MAEQLRQLRTDSVTEGSVVLQFSVCLIVFKRTGDKCEHVSSPEFHPLCYNLSQLLGSWVHLHF